MIPEIIAIVTLAVLAMSVALILSTMEKADYIKELTKGLNAKD